MSEDEPVTKREIDVRFAAMEKFSAEKWIDAEKAVRLARDEINRRIDGHDAMIYRVADETAKSLLQTREREGLFHTRTAHEEFVVALDEKIKNARAELKPRYAWLATAATAILLSIGALWNLSTKPLDLRMNALEEADKHNETIMANHLRDDSNHDQKMLEILQRLDAQRADIQKLQEWWTAHQSQNPPSRR